MRCTTSRYITGLMLLILLVLGLSPGGVVLGAVNQNFDGFAPGTSAESLSISGITSMSSSPPNSTLVQDATALGAPFSGNGLFNSTAGGTLTITFDQPQDSYSMSYETNNGVGSDNFTVTGYRTGIPGSVFGPQDNSVPTTQFVGTASQSTPIFDQLVISSTTQDWGIDNLATTDAPAGITVFQTGGATDVYETGPTNDIYVIALDSPPGAQVDITLAVDSSTAGQCSVSPGTVSFPTGSYIGQPVTVTAIDTPVAEGEPHTCIIDQTVTAGDSTYLSAFLAPLDVTVHDNDTAGITISPTTVAVSEAGVSDTYDITLTSQPTSTVTVNISGGGSCLVNGSPFTTLDFNAANTPQTVTVTAVDDLIAQGTHSCTITHSTSTGDSMYRTPPLVLPDVTGTITDNDTAGLTVSGFTSPNINEAGPTTSDYDFSLDTDPSSSVTIDLTIDASTAGQCTLSTNQITLDTANSPVTVTVTAVDDLYTEASQSCQIDHTTSSFDSAYDGITGNVSIPILDNDVAGLDVIPDNPPNVTVYEAGATSDTYELSLKTVPLADVIVDISVDLSTSGQCKITSPTLPITFTAPFRGPVQITVTAVDDLTPEAPSHPCILDHTVTTAGADYTGITANLTVNVIDNDSPAVPIYSSNPADAQPLTTINTIASVPGTTTLAIKNTGTADMSVTNYSMLGGSAPELTVSGQSLPITVAPGGVQTTTVTVTCNSPVAGTFNGTLQIDHDAAGSPATYTVKCIVSAPGYDSSPVNGQPLTTINTTAGTPGTATLDIIEKGSATLSISNYIMQTGNPELTVSGSPLPIDLPGASGQTSTVTVTCNSPVAGTFNGTLEIDHNATGSPATYPVQCIVTGAPIYSSIPGDGQQLPTIFATTTTSNTGTVVITNPGTDNLSISNYFMLTGSPELTVNVQPLPITVAPGGVQSATITVTCASATTGTFGGTLEVDHNAPGATATYTVLCTVSPPGNPGYGSVPPPGAVAMTAVVNSPGTSIIKVTEIGTAPLIVGPITISGDPELTVSPTSFTIPNGGAAVNVTVQCLSSTAGTFHAQVSIPHNGTIGPYSSPAQYDITCTASTASGPVYTSNPTVGTKVLMQSPGVGQSVSGIVRVTNTGIGTLDLSTITLNNNTSTQLSVILPSNQHLTANQSSDISIQCNATAVGTFTATLSVSHNGSGTAPNPATYPVECTVGTTSTQPGYSSVPAANSIIDVGTVLIGSPISGNLVVMESGGATLNVTLPASGAISGPNAAEFSILSGSPPFSIVNGGTPQTVVIGCVPQAQGLRLGTLTFLTNDPLLPVVTYLLACVGSGVAVTTPTPIGFVPSPVPATATVIIPATGQVTEVKGLAVRTGPYLGATLINVARPGTTYSVLAQNRDEGPYTWYLIQIGRQTGWVSGRYFAVSGTIDAVPFSGSIFDQIDNAPDIGVRLTTNAIIDLRRRPSPRTPRVGTIPMGTEVIVLGRTVQEKQTFWIQVSYNGVVGWVPALPVTMRGPVENLPVR
jgi:Bacterial SH3 domain